MKIKLIPITLAATLLLTARPSLGSESPTARLVWSGSLMSDYRKGAVSPDGRYLAYVDWDTGDLGIQEIATGKRRRLTNKNGSWDDSAEYANGCVWSPDGKQIAYAWESYDGERPMDLRVVALDGGKPRTVFTPGKVSDWVSPQGWSADGKQILALARSDRTNQTVMLLSAADGSFRKLEVADDVVKVASLTRWSRFSLSPDDQLLLYTSSRMAEGKRRFSVSVARIGGSQSNTSETIAEGYSLGWTPDGKGVLFLSAQEDPASRAIWFQPMANGKSEGTPQKLKSVPAQYGIMGFGAMGFTRNGAFYYGISKDQSQLHRIYQAALDPETGRIVSKPTVLVDKLDEASGSYSPDGLQIAYAGAHLTNRHSLSIRSVTTGEVRTFPIDVRNLGGRTDTPRWSRDGRFILMTGTAGSDGHNETHVMDVLTGKTIHSVSGNWAADWSRDGKSIFCVRTVRSSKEQQILIRNLQTGSEKEIFRSAATNRQPSDLALSPDGERLAVRCVRPKSLMILPVSGGEPQQLPGYAQVATYGSPLAWTVDGKHILFVGKGTGEGKTELYRIAVKGGNAERLGLPMEGHSSISVHPDGRRLLVAAVETGAKSEVWALENFAGNTATSATRDQ